MVCGDAVHSPVQKALHQRVPVRGGADGGIHFKPPVVLQVPVAETEVVGPGLAGDGEALGLGGPDEGHAFFCGDVANVVAASRFPDQLDIPLHLPPLAGGVVAREAVPFGKLPVVDAPALVQQGLVLTVGHDRPVQLFCQQHGPPHHLPGLDAPAVVGEAGNRRGQGPHIRQSLPLLPLGDGPVGIDMDPGVPPDGFQLHLEAVRAVGHGVQVWHGAEGGIPSRRRRRRAGGDGLLIRKSRLPKMNVNIYETWNNEMVIQFNDGSAVPGKTGGNGNNTPFGNGNIQGLEAPAAKDGPAGQQQTHRRSPLHLLKKT